MNSKTSSKSETSKSEESSFGHALGENHGQSGSPLGGTLSVDADDVDPRSEGRLAIDKDNAIAGQKHAGHNSGSQSGQRRERR